MTLKALQFFNSLNEGKQKNKRSLDLINAGRKVIGISATPSE